MSINHLGKNSPKGCVIKSFHRASPQILHKECVSIAMVLKWPFTVYPTIAAAFNRRFKPGNYMTWHFLMSSPRNKLNRRITFSAVLADSLAIALIRLANSSSAPITDAAVINP